MLGLKGLNGKELGVRVSQRASERRGGKLMRVLRTKRNKKKWNNKEKKNIGKTKLLAFVHNAEREISCSLHETPGSRVNNRNDGSGLSL